MAQRDHRLLLLSPGDSVFVLRAAVEAGEAITVGRQTMTAQRRLGIGHKIAAQDMSPGDKVIKYGAPIGSVTRPIKAGEHVHLHNMKSDYTATYALLASAENALPQEGKP